MTERIYTVLGFKEREPYMVLVKLEPSSYGLALLPTYINERNLEPYTELTQTNDNMEEKELRLDELLKDHIGTTFYCTIFGDVKLSSIDDFVVGILPSDGVEVGITPSGKLVSTQYLGDVAPVLYPSREAYLKYPLDARKAWMEWQEEQKPKRWTPQIGEAIFWINANLTVSQDRFQGFGTQIKRRAADNEFKTGKEAQQAARAVREFLKLYTQKNRQ